MRLNVKRRVGCLGGQSSRPPRSGSRSGREGNGSHKTAVCGVASVNDVPLLPGLVNFTSRYPPTHSLVSLAKSISGVLFHKPKLILDTGTKHLL